MEELINSLNTIKNHCKEQPNCEKCVLASENGLGCALTLATPIDWNVMHFPFRIVKGEISL